MTDDAQIANREQWGSRLGYILSTLGMSVGVGAVWRFPMMTSQYGGGAFVLAFIIITILVVLPAGWAESAFGRKYRKGVLPTLEEAGGKKGKALGWLMTITPIGLMAYYPIIIANILVYIFYTIAGAPFLNDVDGFFEMVNDRRAFLFLLVIAVNGITALISVKGIQKGIEKCCKIMLPLMLVVAMIISIRVLTLDGIGDGVRYYLKPDFAQLKNPALWTSAAGMALFAVGLGPGFLLTYGSYLDETADLASDFLTVNLAQLITCLLFGFTIVPATVLFQIENAAGKGILFQTLPLVFSKIPGGMIWFFIFMVALLFSGISATIAQVEVPVTSLKESLHLSRNKSIAIVTGLTTTLAIPCVWSDAFFTFFDNLIGNIFYCITAAALAIFLAWFVGAKTIREEWYNPTSRIQYGSWVDVLYKYIACPAFLYFAVTSLLTLF